MKHIRVLLASLAILMGFATMLPLTVSAETPQSSACEALGTGANCTGDSGNSVDLTKIITIVINVFSVIVGVVAVFMIVVGGFRYVTSNGDSNNITSAKNTILYAIVGLIIVAMAQAIVQFVLNRIK